MPKGLPKWAIKEAKKRGARNIFAYAWTLVKRKGRRRRSTKTARVNPKRVTKTARRRRYYPRRTRRRSSQMTIPIAPVAGLVAGLAEPADYLIKGDMKNAMLKLCKNYTGYNYEVGLWSPEDLKRGLLPLVVGLLVHKFVGGPPLNLNRMLGRAKVPLIRI